MCCVALATLIKEKNPKENTIGLYISHSNIAHNYKKNINTYKNIKEL